MVLWIVFRNAKKSDKERKRKIQTHVVFGVNGNGKVASQLLSISPSVRIMEYSNEFFRIISDSSFAQLVEYLSFRTVFYCCI